MGSPRSQLASSLTFRGEGSHVALAQDVVFGRPPRPKLSGIDVVVDRLSGDTQYVCGFSNCHDLDTPLLGNEFPVCYSWNHPWTVCTRFSLTRRFMEVYALGAPPSPPQQTSRSTWACSGSADTNGGVLTTSESYLTRRSVGGWVSEHGGL